MIVPKYLKMKIYEEQETLLFFQDFFCHLRNESLERKIIFENGIVSHAKVFDQEKKLFFLVTTSKNLKTKESTVSLIFFVILNLIFKSRFTASNNRKKWKCYYFKDR